MSVDVTQRQFNLCDKFLKKKWKRLYHEQRELYQCLLFIKLGQYNVAYKIPSVIR